MPALPCKKSAPRPDFSFEDKHSGIVCGVDEVGRGPLAGPVVAAAVVLDRARIPDDILGAIHDSKKLGAAKRAYLYDKINAHARVSIAASSVEEIDDINILQATMQAMQRAVAGLSVSPDVALIDGNRAPKLSCAAETIIKGDSKSLSIAAASIVAKHYRDTLMQNYAKEFPQYGWETNAGYGSAKHIQAIEMYGVTIHHRRSFAPVSYKLLQQKTSN